MTKRLMCFAVLAAVSVGVGGFYLRKTGDGNFVKPRDGQKASSVKMPQKTPQKIMAAIRWNPVVRTQEIADMLGVERSTVARAIAKLKAAGRLRRIGPDKGGSWEVVD